MSFNQNFSPRVLPVLETVLFTFRYLWLAREAFMSLAFPGILLLSILSTALSLIFKPMEGVQISSDPATGIIISSDVFLSMLIALPAVTFFVICFAVGWHRRYLVAGDQGNLWKSLSWSYQHTKFLVFTIGLSLMMTFFASAGLIFASLGGISIFVTLAILIIMYSRLSFVLPAAAIQEPTSFTLSWQLTKGHTMRVAAIIGAIWLSTIVLTIILGQILQMVFSEPVSFMGVFVIAFIFRFLSFVSIALIVTALSVIYEFLHRTGAGPLDMRV